MTAAVWGPRMLINEGSQRKTTIFGNDRVYIINFVTQSDNADEFSEVIA
jgi:hypothetical protein